MKKFGILSWLWTEKRLVYVFLIYGFTISLEINRVSTLPGEYNFHYLLNLPVENIIIIPILLYFANTAGTPLNSDQILVLRTISSVAIWGLIGLALYILGRICVVFPENHQYNK